MTWDITLARLVHIGAGIIWAGGGIWMVWAVEPNVKAAGEHGQKLMANVIRRGGFGKYFGIVATLTIVGGFYLYWRLGYHENAFATPSVAVLSVGALLGVAAYVHALTAQVPVEKEMKFLVGRMDAGQGPPAAEDVARMQVLAKKMGRATRASGAMIVVAVVAMASFRYL